MSASTSDPSSRRGSKKNPKPKAKTVEPWKQLLDNLLQCPSDELIGTGDRNELLHQLYEHLANLAATDAPDDAIVYYPPILPKEDYKTSQESSPAFLAILRQLVANARRARLNLTTATQEQVLREIVPAGADALPRRSISKAAKAARAAEKAAKSTPAKGGQATAGLEAKLNRCIDALRLIRSAQRQVDHLENLAAQTQTEIARYTQSAQNAPRSLRDYRLQANLHARRANEALAALIKRTAELESVPPECPGRNSPPPKTPASLGPLPKVAQASAEPTVDLLDFSRPFSADLTAASRASRAEGFRREKVDESVEEESDKEEEPPSPKRPRKNRK